VVPIQPRCTRGSAAPGLLKFHGAMGRASREASRASRLTTTPVNLGVATEAAKQAAQAAAKRTISLRKAIAVAAVVGSAAAVGIFAGMELGAFDDGTPSTETGPPAAAAPLYGPGDTLKRPDAVADAKARAEILVSRFQAGATGDQNELLINALIEEAQDATTRDAATVFVTLALDLNPDAATAVRLRAALESAVFLSADASGAGVGGRFLEGEKPPREAALAFVGPESTVVGDVADDGAGIAEADGILEPQPSAQPIAETGADGPLPSNPSADDGAGPAPIPLPSPTAASTTQ
jgi:hypothetical protein